MRPINHLIKNFATIFGKRQLGLNTNSNDLQQKAVQPAEDAQTDPHRYGTRKHPIYETHFALKGLCLQTFDCVQATPIIEVIGKNDNFTGLAAYRWIYHYNI